MTHVYLLILNIPMSFSTNYYQACHSQGVFIQLTVSALLYNFVVVLTLLHPPPPKIFFPICQGLGGEFINIKPVSYLPGIICKFHEQTLYP